MNANGTFEIQARLEPPFLENEAVTIARASFDKQFSGALEGTSQVHMLGARAKAPGSAGYGAVEHFTGTLDGRSGSFALVHLGLMGRGAPSLTIKIVPDSGTDQLAGISGEMTIEVSGGKHSYSLSYELPA